jgi:hypothetical protein
MLDLLDGDVGVCVIAPSACSFSYCAHAASFSEEHDGLTSPVATHWQASTRTGKRRMEPPCSEIKSTLQKYHELARWHAHPAESVV